MESEDTVDELGLLRLDATKDGRLVRLADLVVWLAKRDELPIHSAVVETLGRIKTNRIDFCVTRAGQYAATICGHYLADEGQWLGFFIGCDELSTPDQVRSAVIDDLGYEWVGATCRADLMGKLNGRYSIRETEAVRHFAYAAGPSVAITSPQGSVDHPTVSASNIGDLRRKHDKTPAEVAARHAELKSDGRGAETKRLAAELGISTRRVQLILEKARHEESRVDSGQPIKTPADWAQPIKAQFSRVA